MNQPLPPSVRRVNLRAQRRADVRREAAARTRVAYAVRYKPFRKVVTVKLNPRLLPWVRSESRNFVNTNFRNRNSYARYLIKVAIKKNSANFWNAYKLKDRFNDNSRAQIIGRDNVLRWGGMNKLRRLARGLR